MTTKNVHPDPACKPSRHCPNIPGASFMELGVCELYYISDITSDLTEDTVWVCEQHHHSFGPLHWLSP
jgi:hypothetical protein